MSLIEPEAFQPEGFDDTEEHRERFRIDGPNTADWALRKLAQARGRIIENQNLYATEVERLDAWLEDACKAPERDVTFFEALLRNWHEEQLAEDEKRKTISLPGGKLEARQNPPSINVSDPDKFFAWAPEHRPEWVRTKYEAVKSEIKKTGGVDPATGEIAPGVEVVPGDLRWKAVTE
jgi:phage host-nuclease inhibitor protein Gam